MRAELKIQLNAGSGIGHTLHIVLYPVCCQGSELRKAGEEGNVQGGIQRAGIKGCDMEEASVAPSPSKKSNNSTDGRQNNIRIIRATPPMTKGTYWDEFHAAAELIAVTSAAGAVLDS
ncbi:unnamed protein product [Ectocarpus sp. 12 AP-2014]